LPGNKILKSSPAAQTQV